MQYTIRLSALALGLSAACASSPAPKAESAPPAPPKETTVVEVEAPPPPPPPTPEQLAQAKAEEQLAKDRAQMQAEHQAEVARFTPELRAEAQKLADKKYPNGKAALSAVAAGPQRRPEHVARDKDRHPVETLTFLGFKPTLTVLEYGPGEGWYTELLAPALFKQGKLIATNTNPSGPANERSTFYGERFKLFLDTAPELYGKVETLIIDGKQPALNTQNVDMVLAFRTMHGMVNQGTLAAWLAEFHKVLKPGGVLGVEQHRAKPDADPAVSAKQGYLPEQWLIEQIEAAGFKLAGKSEVNANPKDTKDYPEGVWTLPPSLRLGDQDRAKYEAIGESDRMTLKFVKVAKK